MNLPNLVWLSLFGFFMLSFAAQAELKIQNAAYKSHKNTLYVRGTIKGSSVNKVYIIDAANNRQIDIVDTHAGGRKFRAHIPLRNPDEVPCMVMVQTQPRFFFGGATGEYSISKVRKAPKHCRS